MFKETLFDRFGFVSHHHRNIILYRVFQLADRADQPVFIGRESQFPLALRAGQNFQQVLVKAHDRVSFIKRCVHSRDPVRFSARLKRRHRL